MGGGGRRRTVRIVLAAVIAAQTLAGVTLSAEFATRGDATRAALRWVLGAPQRTVSVAEVEARFSPRILRQVPARDMAGMINALAPETPFELTETLTSSQDKMTVLAQGRSVQWRVTIDLDSRRRIDHLSLDPHAPRPPPAKTWADLEEHLRRAAPEVGLLAAEVTGGTCKPVRTIAPDVPLPLASGFKLYVLGAVAKAVDGGRVTWDQQVTIRPGQLVHTSPRYLRAAGEKARVRDLADAMIQNSDNTATDVLIELVGREAVETAMVEMGMADVSRNVPLLLVREWSVLKYGRPPLGAEYLALPDVAARRAFLRDRVATLSGHVGDLAWSVKPSYTEIEWFATPNDQCRALLHLQKMARRPGLRELRSLAGREADRGLVTYLSYKAGGAPGVISDSLYVEVGDDHYVVVIIVRNRDREIALSPAVLQGATQLLRAERRKP